MQTGTLPCFAKPRNLYTNETRMSNIISSEPLLGGENLQYLVHKCFPKCIPTRGPDYKCE